MVWSVAGGIPRSRLIGSAEAATTTGFNFVQISDSHLGFDKAANPNTTATLQEALNDVSALPGTPAFMIHTGDITHLSKPAQFDTCQGLMQQTKLTTYTVTWASTTSWRMTASRGPEPFRARACTRRRLGTASTPGACTSTRPGQCGEPEGQRAGRSRARAA